MPLLKFTGDGRIDLCSHEPDLASALANRVTNAAHLAPPGGTGLGLANVRHSLNRHYAQLEIPRSPGQISRFAVRFPASRVAGVSAIAVDGRKAAKNLY